MIVLGRRVRAFWDRVKQGVVILTEPGRYLRQVAAWQGVGWLCRFAAFWFFLDAFGIGGSFGNVLLVMSVQAIANIVPFTPGGAGAQQALLAATLTGPSRSTVLAFSVGTQIAMAAWSVVLGFGAILLVFRTTDWRGLIKEAQDEAEKEEGGGRSPRPQGRARRRAGRGRPSAARGVRAEADEGRFAVEVVFAVAAHGGVVGAVRPRSRSRASRRRCARAKRSRRGGEAGPARWTASNAGWETASDSAGALARRKGAPGAGAAGRG